MKIYLKSFICYRDTSEVDSDEPYVLVFTADLANASAQTILYGPWGDVDSGERGRTGQFHFGPGGAPLLPPANIWGLSGNAAPPPANPETVVCIAALMENDNGKPAGIRAALHAQIAADLYTAQNILDRSQLVQRLIKTTRDVLTGPIAMGVLNNDDLIGVTEVDLRDVFRRPRSTVINRLISGDGGTYELFFQVEP